MKYAARLSQWPAIFYTTVVQCGVLFSYFRTFVSLASSNVPIFRCGNSAKYCVCVGKIALLQEFPVTAAEFPDKFRELIIDREKNAK